MSAPPESPAARAPELRSSAAGSRAATLRRILSAARSGLGDPDYEFDQVYPDRVRAVSSRFWTPARVAVRAASLLVSGPETRVLDVGAGVGKFCILGAAATGATFVGIEQRHHFVGLAADAAAAFDVRSATFRAGAFDTVRADAFDAFYFFNPFQENLLGPDAHLDDSVPLSLERFRHDTLKAVRMLSEARAGTRVVTYHGMGVRMPPGFTRIEQESHRSGHLELWIKTEPSDSDPPAVA